MLNLSKTVGLVNDGNGTHYIFLFSIILNRRQVLERCITLQLPAKKMKTLFEKFQAFEKLHGDQTRLDYVRLKALEYVEAKSQVNDE